MEAFQIIGHCYVLPRRSGTKTVMPPGFKPNVKYTIVSGFFPSDSTDLHLFLVSDTGIITPFKTDDVQVTDTIGSPGPTGPASDITGPTGWTGWTGLPGSPPTPAPRVTPDRRGLATRDRRVRHLRFLDRLVILVTPDRQELTEQNQLFPDQQAMLDQRELTRLSPVILAIPVRPELPQQLLAIPDQRELPRLSPVILAIPVRPELPQQLLGSLAIPDQRELPRLSPAILATPVRPELPRLSPVILAIPDQRELPNSYRVHWQYRTNGSCLGCHRLYWQYRTNGSCLNSYWVYRQYRTNGSCLGCHRLHRTNGSHRTNWNFYH